MASRPKEQFNAAASRKVMTAAGFAIGAILYPQDDMATSFERSLAHTESQFIGTQQSGQLRDTPLTLVPPISVQKLWAQNGLAGEKITAALATLDDTQQTQLRLRSTALFAQDGFADVIRIMADGKQQKLNDLVAKIADIPSGMRIITTDYASISSEQNKEVWREFQERAEPAFYHYLATTRAAALREAGFCDHAIDCMRRGHGPANAEGIHYNVDIDHLTERKGGGAMCLEKSVDPVLGGAPMYPINHAANLCLIMRDVHTQTKNTINNLQNINTIPVGETRRIIMAVPEQGKELMMLHRQDVHADLQGPKETSYFALGPSLLITRDVEAYKQNIASPSEETTKAFFEENIRADLNHTVKLWTALAQSLEQSHHQGDLKAAEIKNTITNCDEYLKPLERALADIRAPQDAIESLAQVSHRIYAVLSPPADGGRPPPAPGKKPHGHT